MTGTPLRKFDRLADVDEVGDSPSSKRVDAGSAAAA